MFLQTELGRPPFCFLLTLQLLEETSNPESDQVPGSFFPLYNHEGKKCEI